MMFYKIPMQNINTTLTIQVVLKNKQRIANAERPRSVYTIPIKLPWLIYFCQRPSLIAHRSPRNAIQCARDLTHLAEVLIVGFDTQKGKAYHFQNTFTKLSALTC
jgi:hypothetical protein